MRTILLQIGLTLSLLAQGPLCDVLCGGSPGIGAEVPVAGQHGSPSEASCHRGSADPAPTDPQPAHDSCARCEELLAVATDPTSAGTWEGQCSSIISVHGSPGQVSAHPVVLLRTPSGWPDPPDILLLKSTLLI